MSERFARRSQEELWVESCMSMFLKYGRFLWHNRPFDELLHHILKMSGGDANPAVMREKLTELFRSVGVSPS